MSPPVAQKGKALKEPAVCERCGSIFSRQTWRSNRKATVEVLSKATWTTCPACVQAADKVYYGRVLVSGKGAVDRREAIERRIANVARLASARQPERKIVSQEWDGSTLEILTTSQKLAHRITSELHKTFGGTAAFRWSDDDGSLFATLRCPAGATKG